MTLSAWAAPPAQLSTAELPRAGDGAGAGAWEGSRGARGGRL